MALFRLTQWPRSIAALRVFVATVLRTKILRLFPGVQRQGALADDVLAADRVADQRHRLLLLTRRAGPLRSGGRQTVDHAGQEAPDDPDDDQEQDQAQDPADHGLVPGLPAAGPAVPAVSGCACFNVSSAWRAARPSGESGASSTTLRQASAAPARSCLPNAFTMPMFSIVLV